MIKETRIYIPKDMKRSINIFKNGGILISDNSQLLLPKEGESLEDIKRYEPLIGNSGCIWLHPDKFPSYEEAYKYIKKNWLSDFFYFNEKKHFAIIYRDEFKRYRKSDCKEDYSNIHPFLQEIVDHPEDYIYDEGYMHEYCQFIKNNKGNISKELKFRDALQ